MPLDSSLACRSEVGPTSAQLRLLLPDHHHTYFPLSATLLFNNIMSDVYVPPHRRIVTTHVPASSLGPGLEPAARILFDDDKASQTGGQIWHAHTPANETTECVSGSFCCLCYLRLRFIVDGCVV